MSCSFITSTCFDLAIILHFFNSDYRYFQIGVTVGAYDLLAAFYHHCCIVILQCIRLHVMQAALKQNRIEYEICILQYHAYVSIASKTCRFGSVQKWVTPCGSSYSSVCGCRQSTTVEFCLWQGSIDSWTFRGTIHIRTTRAWSPVNHQRTTRYTVLRKTTPMMLFLSLQKWRLVS